jgi:hypothetical protein
MMDRATDRSTTEHAAGAPPAPPAGAAYARRIDCGDSPPRDSGAAHGRGTPAPEAYLHPAGH